MNRLSRARRPPGRGVYRPLARLDQFLTALGHDRRHMQAVFEWTNVGIGLLIGAGAALAAVGVLLGVLNRRTARRERPGP
jgi:hypothetical protein